MDSLPLFLFFSIPDGTRDHYAAALRYLTRSFRPDHTSLQHMYAPAHPLVSPGLWLTRFSL